MEAFGFRSDNSPENGEELRPRAVRGLFDSRDQALLSVWYFWDTVYPELTSIGDIACTERELTEAHRYGVDRTHGPLGPIIVVNPQTGQKEERYEAAFIGNGDSLSLKAYEYLKNQPFQMDAEFFLPGKIEHKIIGRESK